MHLLYLYVPWKIVEDILAAANMERINCFSTEDAITPLPSCCTGAGLQSCEQTMIIIINSYYK